MKNTYMDKYKAEQRREERKETFIWFLAISIVALALISFLVAIHKALTILEI